MTPRAKAAAASSAAGRTRTSRSPSSPPRRRASNGDDQNEALSAHNQRPLAVIPVLLPVATADPVAMPVEPPQLAKSGIISIPLRFEYDVGKSDSNKAKHGIDFEEGQAIWQDDERLEIPARSFDEPRYQVIGRIRGKTWSAFVTYRNEKIRIISIRRAREEEQQRYVED